jgi:hypothetical protein
VVVIVLMVLTASPSFADSEFCWRDFCGRGVGTIPESCEAGRDRIGLLCYSQCPVNMQRFGFDCYSVCPPGMRDDGLFCRLAEYGRGAGYPWQFGDSLNLDGAWARCNHDKPGGCEQNGAIIYPKCKPGYTNVGCCICRPASTPDCEALGLNPGIDLSCAKRVIIGNPVTGACPGQQKNAGLCYPNCNPGFPGVGPVCWGRPPNSMP